MPTNNFVPLPAPANTLGLKMNTFEGTVSAQIVESQGVVITDATNVGTGATVQNLSTSAMSSGTPGLVTQSAQEIYNGAGWDAQLSASAANLGNKSGAGVALSTGPGGWAAFHTPTSGTQASASKTAGGSGVKHVCTGITYTAAVDGTHAMTAVQLNLRDGATGAGSILWSITLQKIATEGLTDRTIPIPNVMGSANTAMTAEFSANGITGCVQSVAMTGFDVS